MINSSDYQGICPKQLEALSEAFTQDRANLVAANASVRNGFLETATDYKALQKLPFTFSVDLKQGSITNQKSSGRCWLFSALNTFRYELIKNYQVEDFELSQNYLFFYDKLERSNFYLENILHLPDEPVDGRLFCFLNADPVMDGGQWDMMANLVRKYGVVPKYVYPDGANSIASRPMNQYLTSLLREYAIELRQMQHDGADCEKLQERKMAMMKDVYRVIAIALGEPPKTFDLTMTSKDGKVYREYGIDGKTFFLSADFFYPHILKKRCFHGTLQSERCR